MKHILIPFDFSEAAKRALLIANTLADSIQAQITVLYAVEPPSGRFASAKKEEVNKEYVIDEINKSKAELNLSNRNDVIVEHGKASDCICKLAKELEVDLIVMGSRGERELTEWFLGSTTDKVIRASIIPVLTVNPDTPIKTRYSAVFSSNFFGEMYKPFGELQPVMNGILSDIDYLKVVTPSNFEPTQKSLRLFNDFAKEYGVSESKFTTYNDYKIRRGILDYTESNMRDVIVIFTHGRRGVSRLFADNMASELIGNSKAMILTKRLPEELVNDNILFPG